MSKPLIIGRLEYSNSRHLILIDEHALKIGDTIYLKNTLKNGRSHWTGYMWTMVLRVRSGIYAVSKLAL